MYPARWFFNKHEEPTTEVAIRRMWGEDLYLVMPTYEVSEQSASLEIVVNPLVNWIWLGFAVMAIGTGIVLLPERTFAFAMAKFPRRSGDDRRNAAVDREPCGARVCAAHREGSERADRRRIRSRSGLHSEIVCTCGCRRALNNCGMPNCRRPRRAAEDHGTDGRGQGHDEIIATLRPRLRRSGYPHRADRQGLQSAWPGFSRMRLADSAPSPACSWSESGRGARREPPAAEPPQPAEERRCRRGSIASSKTSTSPLSPTPPTSDSLRPWQFFTLGALVCATAAVFIIRGTSAENLIFVCLGIFSAALVGLAALTRCVHS